MNHSKRHSCIVLSLLIASCGGGSSSNEMSSTYFEVVDNAFDKLIPASLTPESDQAAYPGIFKIFDRNNDGHEDILYVVTSFRWGYTGNGPSYGVLNYWENTGTGSFKNRTDEVFDEHTVDVATRKIRFADVNKDGIEDILFSSNKEDGRNQSNDISIMESPNPFFISKPDGSYEQFMVGIPAWTHHAEIADIDNDGVLEVIDGSFTQGVKIYDVQANGTWTDSTSSHTDADDAFHPDDMVIADFSGDGCVDSVAARRWPEQSERSYFIGDCNGNFNLARHFKFTDSTFLIPGKTWNNVDQEFKVSDIDGEWYAGLSNYWSHAADFDNDGDLDLLYAVETTLITEEERNNSLYIEGGDFTTHLLLLRNNAGTFEKVTAIHGGMLNIGLYFGRVVDVNSDGFLDLVVDDHLGWTNQHNLNDVIFYNKGDGTFVQNTTELASGSLVNELKSAVPLDFNNDGLMDFVVRKPCVRGDSCEVNNIRLLKGIKSLPLQ